SESVPILVLPAGYPRRLAHIDPNYHASRQMAAVSKSAERYRSTDISGDYAALARALGGHGERITSPGEIVPAIKRGIAATEAGQPALLEFMTSKETSVSRHPRRSS
ncbi:MAG TPA: thiamine pyrophosphate-dependent enzyme, partial [Pseudonocardia sp.]|nr:thiamine pyrophosphate-dependent enzyme [Pseudonocardia sp.]